MRCLFGTQTVMGSNMLQSDKRELDASAQRAIGAASQCMFFICSKCAGISRLDAEGHSAVLVLRVSSRASFSVKLAA